MSLETNPHPSSAITEAELVASIDLMTTTLNYYQPVPSGKKPDHSQLTLANQFLEAWKCSDILHSYGILCAVALLGVVSLVCFTAIAYYLAVIVSYSFVRFVLLPILPIFGCSQSAGLLVIFVTYITLGYISFHECTCLLFRLRDNWLLDIQWSTLYSILHRFSYGDRLDLLERIESTSNGPSHWIFLTLVYGCTSSVSADLACAVVVAGVAVNCMKSYLTI